MALPIPFIARIREALAAFLVDGPHTPHRWQGVEFPFHPQIYVLRELAA